MAFACLQEVRYHALQRDHSRPEVDSIIDRAQQVPRVRNRLFRAHGDSGVRESNDSLCHARHYRHRMASRILVSFLFRSLRVATRDLLLQASDISHETSIGRQDESAAPEADGLRRCSLVRIGMYMLSARDQLGRTAVCIVKCSGHLYYRDRSRFASRAGPVGIVR